MTITLKLPRLRKPKFPVSFTLPDVSRAGRDLAAQAVGVVAVLVGVSAWSAPCAFILGGLVLVAGVEMQAKPGESKVT